MYKHVNKCKTDKIKLAGQEEQEDISRHLSKIAARESSPDLWGK
jgi:hypothetical protein